MCQVVVLLCAFADRPATQRVNIFTSPSKETPQESGPNSTRFRSFQTCLLATDLTLERKRVRHATLSLRARSPRQVIYLSIYALLANTSLRNQEWLGGMCRGRSCAVREPRHSENEQRAAKVEHSSTCPFEKKLHLFRVNEGAVLKREEDCEGFLEGRVGAWQLRTVSSCSHVPALPRTVPAAHIVRSFADGQWEVRQKCEQP